MADIHKNYRRDYGTIKFLLSYYGHQAANSFGFFKKASDVNWSQITRRYPERQGLFERDAENSYLAPEAVPEDPMAQLLGHSITYRIAVGPQAGRKVCTLQSLPGSEPHYDNRNNLNLMS